MSIGPPARGLVSELVITALIYIGAVGASLLAALFISAVAVGLIPGDDEGALFLQPAILNCVLLLVNPALFASVAANHGRRTPAYSIALIPVVGLSQTVLFWLEHSMSADEAIAAVFSAVVGLALGYWVLRRKGRNFRLEAGALATNH